MDVLGELTTAIDVVCATDPARLADREAMQALHRQLERLEAATTRASAAFATAGAWEADGARSAAAWVATRCRVPVAAARRRLRLGRALRHMALAEASWLAGDIDGERVDALATARTPVSSACFARDQALLVEQAARLSPRHFARALAYWRHRADPDGVEDGARAAHAARRVHLSQSLRGGWVLDGAFDPIGGAVLHRTLKDIEDEFFAADWAEAGARVGAEVCAADLVRTPAQRRADATVEMARRARQRHRRT